MRDFASFQRPHIIARDIDAPIGEAAEKNRDVPRGNRHKLRRIFRVANFPSALAHQPLNERDDGAGQAFVDRELRNPRASVGLRHGQGNKFGWPSMGGVLPFSGE